MNSEAFQDAGCTAVPLPDALDLAGRVHRCDRGDDCRSEVEIGTSTGRFQEHVSPPVAASSGERDEELTVLGIAPNTEASKAEAE
jgi:hypothetical protein